MSKAPEGRTRNEKVFGSHSKKAVVEQNTKNKQTNKQKKTELSPQLLLRALLRKVGSSRKRVRLLCFLEYGDFKHPTFNKHSLANKQLIQPKFRAQCFYSIRIFNLYQIHMVNTILIFR